MAWTAQSWRFSLAGAPDPSQGFSELQARLAFAGVPVGTTALYEPVSWDYDESLTLTYTPLGTSGFDVTTRYAIAGVAAVNLADSLNRDGLIDVSLSTFAFDLDGTNVLPTFDGSIDAVLSGFSVSLDGEYQNRLYFDVSYAITPSLIFTEQPARFGDIAATIAGFSFDLDGTALPPGAIDGFYSLTLAGFSPDFDGTMTPAPARDGDIGLDVEIFSTSMRGVSTPADSNIGSVAFQTGDFSIGLAGTFEPQFVDGFSTLALDAFALSAEGAFIDANATFGLVPISVGDFIAGLSGLNDSPEIQEPEAPGIPVVNANATTNVPQNYVICDRTGFKIRPEDAVKEWNGRIVRRQSYEARHPQDYVRSRSETLESSERPEQDDQFIEDLYPNDVTAADL